MAKCNLMVDVSIKKKWAFRLLFLMNVPVVLFGFEPCVPMWFVRRNMSFVLRTNKIMNS